MYMAGVPMSFYSFTEPMRRKRTEFRADDAMDRDPLKRRPNFG